MHSRRRLDKAADKLFPPLICLKIHPLPGRFRAYTCDYPATIGLNFRILIDMGLVEMRDDVLVVTPAADAEIS